MTRQLAFDLELRPALGREDFLVTESNAAAVALVDRWPDWPSHAAVLIGPPGSGKTHLAEVFCQKSGAVKISAAALTVAGVPEILATGAAVVEDCGPGVLDERAAFHAYNFAKQESGHILFTSETAPRQWNITLPDLVSRLNATPAVHILLPDDALLRGVIVKHFMDRQINVPEQVVSYLATRIPRSLGSVREIIAEIDRRALEERADVTRPLVTRVLAAFTNPGLFADGEDTFTEPS